MLHPSRREANGRRQRSTVAQVKKAMADMENIEKQTVLAQPHRGGTITRHAVSDDCSIELGSLDQKRESALGRFVDDHAGLWTGKDELDAAYEAGRKYWALVHRWRSMNDIPEAIRLAEGAGTELDESEQRELNAKLKHKIDHAKNAIKRYGMVAFLTTRDLCLEEVDPHPLHIGLVKIGLDILALEFGLTP
jgi:hypothetical protein